MGLALRYNLFYSVEAEQVYQALASFWAQRHCRLRTTPLQPPRGAYTLYEPRADWTLLDWDGGWEWELRRQAQLHVSRVLGCAGLLVFVYDGDYWGYEVFYAGVAVDHFVQDSAATGWFPGYDCSGRPHVLAAQFPGAHLRPADIATYLTPIPENWDTDLEWNRPARTGDEFSRGDECAVVDFLRMLGVGVELRDDGNGRRRVTPTATRRIAFELISSDEP